MSSSATSMRSAIRSLRRSDFFRSAVDYVGLQRFEFAAVTPSEGVEAEAQFLQRIAQFA